MKLASLSGGRDGHLVVVSRDLSRMADAAGAAPTLQAALDDWDRVRPLLAELATAVETGGEGCQAFDPAQCASPLPRAYQWADGSAYVNHVELVRRARNAEMPASFWTDPLMYQGGSDGFLAPTEAIPLVDEAWGLDFEAEVAVVVGDVSLGAGRRDALNAIRLVMLANDVSLRNLVPGEIAKSFGFFQSKPASAFSPVAVTPDELGGAWRDGKLHRPILVSLNGRAFGRPNAGEEMTFDFGTLIAHAAKTRALAAGTIVGSGTVSNKGMDGGPGQPIDAGGKGYACIAELRSVETILSGAPKTPFLAAGDEVAIEMRDERGASIFGAIRQRVAAASPAALESVR